MTETETVEVTEAPKVTEESLLTPKASFSIDKPVSITEQLTNPSNAIDKTIEDVMVLMYETFDKLPECNTSEGKILKDESMMDVRLAELGIDRRFKLEDIKDGISYRSHVFDACICDTSEESTEPKVTES